MPDGPFSRPHVDHQIFPQAGWIRGGGPGAGSHSYVREGAMDATPMRKSECQQQQQQISGEQGRGLEYVMPAAAWLAH